MKKEHINFKILWSWMFCEGVQSISRVDFNKLIAKSTKWPVVNFARLYTKLEGIWPGTIKLSGCDSLVWNARSFSASANQKRVHLRCGRGHGRRWAPHLARRREGDKRGRKRVLLCLRRRDGRVMRYKLEAGHGQRSIQCLVLHKETSQKPSTSTTPVKLAERISVFFGFLWQNSPCANKAWRRDRLLIFIQEHWEVTVKDKLQYEVTVIISCSGKCGPAYKSNSFIKLQQTCRSRKYNLFTRWCNGNFTHTCAFRPWLLSNFNNHN